MGNVIVDRKKENQMDQVLGTILCQKSPNSHYSAEGYRLFAELYVILYTERVKDSGEKHVLTDKSMITVRLDLR